MSSIILRAGVVLSSAMLVLSLGCSDARTPKSLINPDTGKHDTGWESPDSHGAAAKAAAGSTTGFAVCQECHADNFIGGISNITCLNTAGCHGAAVSAPHSPKPWRGGTRTHTNTDQSNAPICALCHTNGANSSLQPSPFDSGAAPGCFNNTLCHGAVGHAAGWADPDSHGATAKSAPTSTTGFSYCQTCHGNDFTGGTSLADLSEYNGLPWSGCQCSACSVMVARRYVYPHDHGPGKCPRMRALSFGQQKTTFLCSVPAGKRSGCFNNTLCHGAVGHSAGWADPGHHGATAKSAPGITSGFSYCQTCHGSDFTGGTALQTCLNTAGCHGTGVNSPHAASWLPGDTYTHSTTNQGNAPVCGLCHLGGRTPPSYATVPAGTTPNCFDNTLCHGDVGAPHVVPYTDPALHGPAAKADLTYCQSCHSDKPSGGPGSNPRFNVAKGSLATGCEGASCHATNMAHPSPWRGLIANDTGHMTAGNMANACALCHGVNLAAAELARHAQRATPLALR